ncbi:hypothetical protein [Synechococcus sp. C9]|uniref:hypothetical protein n=1 Tax=Synechococcus sp. C9 TaxID=102119 RepID=UPI001FF5FDDA|nr:hypothetical protein [Synechococcus sp. C9]
MKSMILASAVSLGLAAMGTPALANPYHYGQQPVIYPYSSFVQVYPSVPVYGGVYVAPLRTQPVYGVVAPYAVTAYPYVNYNSKTGFSYGFTTLPGGAYPTVGGYTTPVYGPGWVIYPNAPRYGY